MTDDPPPPPDPYDDDFWRTWSGRALPLDKAALAAVKARSRSIEAATNRRAAAPKRRPPKWTR